MIPVQRRYREGVVWGQIMLSLLILFHWVVLMAAVNEIHAFYYMWYGNVSFDGRWKHWDHEILPHWQSSVNLDFPQIGKRHHPPGSLHSPFYPLRGPYSSSDPFIISSHFHEMRDAGIGVAVLSWWGQRSRPESRDTQGVSTDEIIPLILATASALDGISVAFHLEPYPGRTAQSTAEDLRYLHEKYGDSKALYRINGKMVFYIYDSYHISSSDWAKYLTPQGERTIRGSQYDSFVIGLWLDRLHGEQLHSAGFDGIYSYFASDGFSFGSTTANWKSMCEYAKKVGMLCNLSVGPGYQDDKIRPWNTRNTKDRQHGMYYLHMWDSALKAAPNMISITSYNEWGEGTQIEPAQALENLFPEANMIGMETTYLDYGDLGSRWYLRLTSEKTKAFLDLQSSSPDL